MIKDRSVHETCSTVHSALPDCRSNCPQLRLAASPCMKRVKIGNQNLFELNLNYPTSPVCAKVRKELNLSAIYTLHTLFLETLVYDNCEMREGNTGQARKFAATLINANAHMRLCTCPGRLEIDHPHACNRINASAAMTLFNRNCIDAAGTTLYY